MATPPQQPPRLSRAERAIVQRFLRVDPAQIEGHVAEAVLVGEAPGPNTRGDCPLLPWPRGSAGGRLMEMSGMEPVDYLRRFQRVNLLGAFPKKGWPRHEAMETARAILLAASMARWPVVVCGARVAAAFGMADEDVYEWRWLASLPEGGRPTWGPLPRLDAGTNVPAVRIPHPSGRSLVYNDPDERAAVRAVLQKAAERRERG